MEEEREILWKSVVWSAVLIFFIPLVIQFAVPAVYATYVGFETRGDQARVNQAVMSIVSANLFWVFIYGFVFGLVAFWRGTVLAQKTSYHPEWHALAAAVLGAAGALALMIAEGYYQVSYNVLLILAPLGGAYLAAYWASRRTKPERETA